jgi:glycosyltransferase involved in cell wall biosynthesis
MGKIRRILIFLVCVAASVLGEPRTSSGPELIIDDSRIYTGDVYKNTITIGWSGNPALGAPKYIKYEPAKGRSVVQINRKDVISYRSSGEPQKGKTIFTVSVKAGAASDSAKTKIIMVFPETSPGVSNEKNISLNEPVVHRKIFNIFKLSELIILIVFLAGLGTGVVLFIRHFRKLKENRNIKITEETDRDMYELNSIGRLVDKKDTQIFINQANSFIEKNIQQINSEAQKESNDKLSFITDIELKRMIMKVRQTLYNARFGGYQPDASEMEDIYQVCKSLFEFRNNKFIENK